jgi:hypothetical protein
MAYTAPGTAVAGDVLTAAFWNQQVRDNITELAGAPFARNILYNGAMQITQRGTSTASITTDGYYTADRWALALQTLGTWTQSVENDAPTGSGLRKSLKMLCTTAKASPSAGDYCFIRQLLEGQDLQRIAKGTSSAQTITVSFWVKSNLTGTFIAELQDQDNNRTISQSYTISASATWEKKTLTFAADTTGAFDNDNAASLALNFWLASGSTYTSGTLQTTWGTRTDANRNVGGTNLAAATSNYWQVTGVQLETGSVATGFEFLPFGDELSRCQRYYEKTYNPETAPASVTDVGSYRIGTISDGLSNAIVNVQYCVPKRAAAGTISFWNTSGTPNAWDFARSGLTSGFTPTNLTNGAHSFSFYGGVAAAFASVYTYGHWAASAEL